MTAATATRSAYPRTVDELIPHARELAEQLGETPSRNKLMKTFHVGADKAKALLAELASGPTRAADTFGPAEPSSPPKRSPASAEGDLSGTSTPVPPDLPDRVGDDEWPPEAWPGEILEDLNAYAPDIATPATDPKPAATGEPVSLPLVPHVVIEDEAARLFELSPRRSAEPIASPESPTPPVPSPVADRAPSRATRYGMAALLTVVGVLLAGVIVAPIALSSQDIIAWAGSPVGLGLTGSWPLVTFLALDAAAAVCVGLVVYCAWRGESAGAFAWLVWAFAGMSAYANYSHSSGSPARDAVWFFPAMSIAGPFLLEIIVRRVRRWVQEGTGQRVRHSVSFGFARWVPGVGALRETYGAWRLARLDHLTDARHAVTAYRRLCPDGSVRVLRALRERDANS